MVGRSFADAGAALNAGDGHAPIALSGRAHMALADVRLEPSMLALQHGDTRVSLEPRVMQVLVALADVKGSVVSRDTLLGQCWGGAVVGDDALHRAVAGARSALRKSGSTQLTIETIARVGYRLVGPADVPPHVGDGMPAVASPSPLVEPPAQPLAAAQTPALAPPLPAAPASPTEVAASTPRPAAAPPRRRVLLIAAAASAAAALGSAAWRSHVRNAPTPELLSLLDRGQQALRLATPEADHQAVGFFDAAVHLAPRHAPGWGLLALARRSLAESTPTEALPDAFAAVEAAAAKALVLDPRQTDALTARALLVPHFGRWAQVDELLQAVLAIDPEHLPALDALAYVLSSAGVASKHYPLRLKTVERDPFNAGYNFRAIYSHWMNGHLAAADRAAERGVQLWPLHPPTWLARTGLFVNTGRPQRALALLDAADGRRVMSASLQAMLRTTCTALVSGHAADHDVARTTMLRAVGTGGPLTAVLATLNLAALGDTELALDLSEAYLLERGPLVAGTAWRPGQTPHRDLRGRMTNFLFLPVTAALRAHPRFMPIARDLGLADYWQRPDRQPDTLPRTSTA